MLKPIFVLVYIVCWTTADTDRSFLISEFDFALSLLNKLPSDKSCIISPFSISLALSLVHSGTKGTSRKEIEQILLKGAANEEFSQHFSNLIHNMSKIEEGVQMEIANRLFIQKGNSLLDSYLSSVRTNYKADAVSLDFNDSNGSAETVNSFVRNVTHEKIKEIVTPDMIDASLPMILVNVLYMDAEWENKFDDYDTEPGIFFVSESNRKNVDFLSHKEVIRDYYENDQYQLLSVKYKDNRYRFNVFLPKQRFMLEKLQSEMSGDKIEEVLNNQLKQERLNILLPKFKLESDLELSQILKDLGIVGIFNGGEDLSGFTGTDNLDVSRVIHKATIEVGENGTVASAVTDVVKYGVCCTTADTDRSLLSSEFDFALSLLNKLPSDKSCIISPFSISLALSLVHSGTKGTSRKEIEQILLKGATNEEFSQHFSNLIANVSKEEKGVEFKLANRVFIKKEYILLNSYLSSIHNNYNADAVSLNFSDSIGSAATVNSFVNEVTHGKIKTIVNENIFDYGLIMLLVNAVYMKGEWAAKFNKHSTWPGTFYVSKTINKEVKYLLDSEVNRDYYENDQFQLLSLKYNDDRYRFNVFLPKEKFALGELQANLTGVNMERYVSKLKMERLNIKLPKFNLESDVNILTILKELGITGIFEGGKDLSGFTGSNALYVSGVIHKAIIEVDEDGTVAAAITAVFMFGYAPPLPQPKPIEFIADHPFMFCITFNNHPLFIGKYH